MDTATANQRPMGLADDEDEGQGPMTRAERREAQTVRILDAAKKCFVRSGFQGASMHDICKEAEMSPGALYRYFPSKEAIIEAIALIPEEYKLRRPFKSSVGNKTYEADTHFKNLWDEYAKNDKLAREILSQLIGGKLYTMLKMAVMWLSKVTLTDMVALDPEDSDERRPPD